MSTRTPTRRNFTATLERCPFRGTAQLPLNGQQPFARVLPTRSQSLLSGVPGIPHALKLSQGKFERSVCRASEAPNWSRRGCTQPPSADVKLAPSPIPWCSQSELGRAGASQLPLAVQDDANAERPNATVCRQRRLEEALRSSNRFAMRPATMHPGTSRNATRKVQPSIYTQQNALAHAFKRPIPRL